MKRITLLAFLVPLLAVSCQKLPDSSFSVSTTTVDADEFVYFYNYSTNADRFEWDFGDGYLSNDYEPFHAYSTPGNYIVTLTAVSKKGYSSRSSAIITVVNNPSGSPNARFTVSTATPTVGEEVYFTNNSIGAASYIWDFGDGIISRETHPTHVYTINGQYEVELAAINSNGTISYAYITIDARIPKMLAIEVVEYYNLYRVPGASVILYPTLEDRNKQSNALCEGFTDDYGIVVFSGLPDDDYFVDVWEENHDNYSLASEDAGFITIEWVEPNTLNWFVAYVDVADHSAAKGRGDRIELVLKDIERKSVAGATTKEYSEEELFELYLKSVKVE
ncbi:MAG TPA: PKD domain-containing protein [Bacteroidetes bacterium]|nr:PKD domain-containing protein [Bacteroidota bacterium]